MVRNDQSKDYLQSVSHFRKSVVVKVLSAAFSIWCMLKGAFFCVNNIVYIHALHFTLVIEDFDTTIDMFIHKYELRIII